MKLCLKYKAEYNREIKSSRIVLSGWFDEGSIENKILLSDFIHLMLEKWYDFYLVRDYVVNLWDFINFWELFVLFAVRWQVVLMSYLLNSEEFAF